MERIGIASKCFPGGVYGTQQWNADVLITGFPGDQRNLLFSFQKDNGAGFLLRVLRWTTWKVSWSHKTQGRDCLYLRLPNPLTRKHSDKGLLQTSSMKDLMLLSKEMIRESKALWELLSCSWPGDVTPLVERFPKMHKALSLIPKHTDWAQWYTPLIQWELPAAGTMQCWGTQPLYWQRSCRNARPWDYHQTGPGNLIMRASNPEDFSQFMIRSGCFQNRDP